MGDTALNVPIRVRTHELEQLHGMVPEAIQQIGTDEADELKRVYDEHIGQITAEYPEGPQFAAYVSMPIDDWRTVISGLNRARYESGRPRVHWLQSKLVGRLEDRSEEL